MQNKIYQLTEDQFELISSDFASVVGEFSGLLDEIRKAQDSKELSELTSFDTKELLEMVSKKLAEHKNLLDGGKDYLSEFFTDLLNEASKEIVKQSGETKDTLIESNEEFKADLDSLLKAHAETTKDRFEKIDKSINDAKLVEIEVDQEAITKAISRAVARLDYGKFAEFITEMNKVKLGMVKSYEDSAELSKGTKKILDEVDERNRVAVQEFSDATHKTNDLMRKQIKDLNGYTHKANLFDYFMVFTGTSIAWGVGAYLYAPELVKKIFQSLLTQIQ